MNTNVPRSAHDDVLAKMDALLKRHQDRLEKIPDAVPVMDFPVLTEVVHYEEEVIPVLTEVVEDPVEMSDFPFLLLEDEIDERQTLELFEPRALSEPSEPFEPTQISGLTEPVEPPGLIESAELVERSEASGQVEFSEPSPPDEPQTLSGQSLKELDQQIQAILDQRLSAHIFSAMDQAMSSMLEQFSVQLESVVREAVAEELRKQLSEIAGRANDAGE